jgi:hypothetical protein
MDVMLGEDPALNRPGNFEKAIRHVLELKQVSKSAAKLRQSEGGQLPWSWGFGGDWLWRCWRGLHLANSGLP